MLACLESEWGHYDRLDKFLNACLAACRAALGDTTEQANLNFFIWDGPQKPDEVFWSLAGSAPQRNSTLSIRPGARLRTHKTPLSHSAVSSRRSHSSEDLNPFDSDGRKDFLQLLLSILSWKCRADVGFPAWCDEANVSLCRPEEEPETFVFDIENVLNTCACVLARSPCVFHIRLASSSLDSVNPTFCATGRAIIFKRRHLGTVNDCTRAANVLLFHYLFH
ncbi:hypothetical protein BT96DRAFT_1000365 [Gymnopus androsaceus JB14]|uniref:Uncharacterized protein n=1 Tax=Gymnopus androsaceus JB14 TaxID=1447944 RepID=A0A6A4H3R2_9AGAR|nr:hypothetical protein BT96DRAFT_1000365 [Gymnopus androsaceus JB14]